MWRTMKKAPHTYHMQLLKIYIYITKRKVKVCGFESRICLLKKKNLEVKLFPTTSPQTWELCALYEAKEQKKPLPVNLSFMNRRYKGYINLSVEAISYFMVIAESFVTQCCCAALKDQKVGLGFLLASTQKNYEVSSETWDSSWKIDYDLLHESG